MRFPPVSWGLPLATALLFAGGLSLAKPNPSPTADAVPEATLSYLKDVSGRCRWLQHTPPADPRTLATLPVACHQVRLAWSADGAQGLVHFKTEGLNGEEMAHLWRVRLDARQHTVMTLPPQGDLARHGFDAEGRPLVFLEDPVDLFPEDENPPEQKGYAPYLKVVPRLEGTRMRGVIAFEGQDYPASDTGIPGLAHAFRWEEGGWTRIETRSTSYEEDAAPGVRALEALQSLGPSPEAMEDAARERFTRVTDTEAVRAKLPSPKHPAPSAPVWRRFDTAAGPLYLTQVQEGGITYDEGPVYTEGPKGLEPLPLQGARADSALTLFTRGSLVLVVGDNDQGTFLRLWDMKARRMLFALEGPEQASFWPLPVPQKSAAR